MRLELSKRTDQAIRALSYLCDGDPDSLIPGLELATGIEASTNYLPQIMTPLIRNLWVESVPGPSGGYRLIQDAGEISLLDVIEAVEGPTTERRCVLRGAPCPVEEPCALHEPWTRARDALLSELASTPVSEIGCRARK